MNTLSSQAKTLILFGTQTGTAEDLAEQLSDKLATSGVNNHIENMFDVNLEFASSFHRLIIIISTWGDGEPPDDGEAFHLELINNQSNILNGNEYAVFGLGDSGYEQFCQCAIDFDRLLEKSGARRLLPRVDADIDYDDLYDEWAVSITQVLSQQQAFI